MIYTYSAKTGIRLLTFALVSLLVAIATLGMVTPVAVAHHDPANPTTDVYGGATDPWQVHSLFARVEANGTVTLDWQVGRNSHDEVSIRGFWVELYDNDRNELSYACTYLNDSDDPLSSMESTECNLAGLHSQTSYTVQVGSLGHGGQGGVQSAVVEFTTPPPLLVTDLSARTQANGDVLIDWAIDGSQRTRSIHGFYVTITESSTGQGASYCDDLNPPVVGLVSTQCTIPGLFAGGNFSISVTHASPGSPAQRIDYRQPLAPPRAQGFAAVRGVSSLQFSWAHDGHEVPVTYTVWLEGDGLPVCSADAGVGANVLRCSISGLQPDTQYRAHLYSEDSIGQRSGDVVIDVRTKAEPAPEPEPERSPEPEQPDPEPDPNAVDGRCRVDGRFYKVMTKKIDKAWVAWEVKTARAEIRLDDRPKRLEKAVKSLEKRRDRKVNKALRTYEKRCPELLN